ncbi:hypothetical protein GC170_01520 [bacterium]|nr:hypothetical protein [bacterium]
MKNGSRRHVLAFGLGGAVISARPVWADILLPGSKFVSHKIKFENLKEYEKQYKFFFLPMNQGEGPEWVKAQAEFAKTGVISVSGINPLQVARADGLYLVAVPIAMLDQNGTVSPAELLKPPPGILKSERLVGQIRAVRKEDKDEFWTVYHVRIMDGKLQTGLIRHDEPMRRDRVKSNSFGAGATAILTTVVAASTLLSRFRNRTGQAIADR